MADASSEASAIVTVAGDYAVSFAGRSKTAL